MFSVAKNLLDEFKLDIFIFIAIVSRFRLWSVLFIMDG